MKKFYRIILLLTVFIILTTYSPNELKPIFKKNIDLFEIKNIEITNNSIIEKDEIQRQLNLLYGKNIFFVKKNEIQEPLKNISFLERIEVKKKYPNKIIVKIFETRPVAYLFKNKSKYLLDSSSKLIVISKNIEYGELPNIFGKDAENYFISFYNLLKNINFPKKK